jgi:hypothetical protein
VIQVQVLALEHPAKPRKSWAYPLLHPDLWLALAPNLVQTFELDSKSIQVKK